MIPIYIYWTTQQSKSLFDFKIEQIMCVFLPICMKGANNSGGFISHCILFALCRIQILYHVPMVPTVGNQDCETLQIALCVRWECTASLINPMNIQLLNQWVIFPLLFLPLVTGFTFKEAALVLFWSFFNCNYNTTLTSLPFSHHLETQYAIWVAF